MFSILYLSVCSFLHCNSYQFAWVIYRCSCSVGVHLNSQLSVELLLKTAIRFVSFFLLYWGCYKYEALLYNYIVYMFFFSASWSKWFAAVHILQLLRILLLALKFDTSPRKQRWKEILAESCLSPLVMNTNTKSPLPFWCGSSSLSALRAWWCGEPATPRAAPCSRCLWKRPLFCIL